MLYPKDDTYGWGWWWWGSAKPTPPEPEIPQFTINNPLKVVPVDTPATYTAQEALDVRAQRLATPSWNTPSQVQTVTLGDRVYRVRLTYRKRPQSWYLDLYNQQGEPLLLGRRITPGWALNMGHHFPDEPLGPIVVAATKDPYTQDELGRALTVTFYPADRIKVATPVALAAVSVDLGV